MPEIALVRLTEVPLDALVAILDDRRLARHMPLWAPMSRDEVAGWVRAKDAQWGEHGYGPWAVLVDGRTAGWAGFQREDVGPDLGVVLGPAWWGHGVSVVEAVLAQGFTDLGLAEAWVSLPPSRSPDRVLERYGFEPAGTATVGGAEFRTWRLTRERYLARGRPPVARP